MISIELAINTLVTEYGPPDFIYSDHESAFKHLVIILSLDSFLLTTDNFLQESMSSRKFSEGNSMNLLELCAYHPFLWVYIFICNG